MNKREFQEAFRIAQEATAGPWEWVNIEDEERQPGEEECNLVTRARKNYKLFDRMTGPIPEYILYTNERLTDKNAKFIEYFNPDKINSMLNYIRELEILAKIK